MTTRRKFAWVVVVVLVVAVGLYAELVRETTHHEPPLLLACAEVDYPWTAWTCKQVLLHDSLRPDQVAELNSNAGARLPVQIKDPALAEEMLSLFLSRGVDINAGSKHFKGRTALHDAAISGAISEVNLLLKHGARLDVRDETGDSPLDYAIMLLRKFPNQPNRAEVVRLLEEAEKRQSAQK